MALRVIKCSSIDELQAILQGAVKTKKLDTKVMGLVGKTLTFTQPTAATCTFVDGANSLYLTIAEIITQLKAAIANLTVGQKDGSLYLRSTNTSGVSITGGTARADFGFDGNGTVTGLVYAAPGGPAPVMVTAYACGDAHVLIVDEA